MKALEMWQKYQQINPNIGEEMDAWAFGAEPDLLANLVLEGTKTATASAFDLYEVDDEPLPKAGTYDVILNSQDEAVCVIEVTKVSVLPFKDVSKEHAFKEGEGDRSLAYWRQVHEALFREWLAEVNQEFNENSKIVLEEFKVVYPKK
ncbi:ASCH domain-containing protein [Streptococcus thoraltensis]|uniref:ASCH domain-containing protein n=1 Tax=Streptococcus thoraltensis TaxID=55085 RepID=UPI00037F7EFD|nr:ASCH domain-containing protein [Streptococcus thoraltensis]MDY4762028.1 ASCH domain-containing protein [Streptococcus thoraltensis]